MNLQRVRHMGVDEVVCRGRQQASKWVDRTWRPRRPMKCALAIEPDCFHQLGQERFFAGAASHGIAGLMAEHAPEALSQLRAEADALLHGQFDLLGYRALSFGEPIDWHLDPIAGQRSRLVHWSRIDPLNPYEVGDSKIVWELNRHQWMVRLSQAYRVTGDERYAQAVADRLQHWRDANPPGIGINWTSSLEVSYRLIAWCWCLFLLEGSQALSPNLFDTILGQVWLHARHIERYLSYYFSPNTHLTGEALGLWYAGQIFQEWPQAARWASLGERILTDQCRRQILSDGVYFERATCYQRYTLEIYLHFLILAERNRRQVSAQVIDRTARMLDFVLALRLPDGSVPQIGDADSGTVIPLSRRSQDDFRGVLSTAAVVFGRSDCAWASGGITSELLWLFGPDAIGMFEALCSSPPSRRSSCLFEEGGYLVMRGGWQEPDESLLIFDVGPLGGEGSAGHGHADLLSVQCAAFGQSFLVDAGTYCYTADPPARDFFRGSASHSTVTVDGQSQATACGPFRWCEHPRARIREWRRTQNVDFADAEYNAEGRVSGFERHRRRVVHLAGRGWIIVDDLEGDGSHQVDLRFQFAPIDLQIEAQTQACARGTAGCMLVLKPFAAAPIAATVHCGELHPMQGWISREYGRRQPAPVLRYSARAMFPFRVATVIVPVAPDEHVPVVSAAFDSRRRPAAIVFDETGERLTFGDDGLPVLDRLVPVRAEL